MGWGKEKGERKGNQGRKWGEVRGRGGERGRRKKGRR